jgi:hypothetical protein
MIVSKDFPIPESDQGLQNYIRYAKKQIKANDLANKKLYANIEICEERLAKKKEAGKNE